MAQRPVVKNMNATSVGVLNWILADASGYLAGAPAVADTVQSIRQIGEFINAYQPRQNQFLSALINRVALVIVSSKSYRNPWNWVKRGNLETGESLEEIYVNLAKVENFNTATATNSVLADLFGKRKPDVQAAFHQMNFQKKYPVTVSEEQLRAAFTTMEGVNSLIEYVVQSLYTAFEYDEYIMYQYLIGRLALEGKIKTVTIPEVNATNSRSIVSQIKAISNDLTFMKTEYNMAGVYTHTPKEDQFVLKSTDADAIIDVEVLSLAFNMDKSEFAGQQVLLDTFDDAKIARLSELLGDDDTFEAFTSAEIAKLNTIKFVIIDREFLMQYDKLVKMSEQYIPNNLEWNYFLHHWAIFSASPFRNAVLLSTAESAVTGITLTPSEVDAAAGQSIQFTADVTTTGFADADVTWSVSGAEDNTTAIDRNGLLTIGAAETADLTVTATSVADPEVFGEATVTIA